MASSSEEETVEITGGPHNHTRPRVGLTPSDGRVPHNVEAARAAEVAPTLDQRYFPVDPA